MTDLDQNPAGGAPAEPTTTNTNGGAPLANGSAAGGVFPAPDAAGANPSGDDYFGKVRAHPDFAVEQVRTHQSRADRAAQELSAYKQKLGKLTSYLETVDGDRLAQIVGDHVALANDPAANRAVSQFLQTGKWSGGGQQGAGNPAAETSVEEEYLTDEEREIRSLRQELSSLRGEVTQHSSAQGRDALIRHLSRFSSNWGLTDEQKQKVSTELLNQVQTWERSGDTGLAAIKQLMSPQGEDTVKMLALRSLGDDGILEVARGRVLRDQGARGALATDVPSRSSLANATPEPAYTGALDALQWAMDHPEALGEDQ